MFKDVIIKVVRKIIITKKLTTYSRILGEVMKKLNKLLLMGIVLVSTGISTSPVLNALEIQGADTLEKDLKASGNWYSSVGGNLDGVSNVGTTNHSSNHSFTLKIYDVDGGDYEYSHTLNLSNGSEWISGKIYTTVNHDMQGQVITTSSSHSPWFNS